MYCNTFHSSFEIYRCLLPQCQEKGNEVVSKPVKMVPISIKHREPVFSAQAVVHSWFLVCYRGFLVGESLQRAVKQREKGMLRSQREDCEHDLLWREPWWLGELHSTPVIQCWQVQWSRAQPSNSCTPSWMLKPEGISAALGSLENPMDGGAWWAAVHGVARVEHDWVTSLSIFTFMHWRRKWQPTPVFLPGESQRWGSLVGCRLWGHRESDTTEVT